MQPIRSRKRPINGLSATIIVQLQPQVEAARSNEVRLHALADGVLALAPRDPIAARLVNDFKIHDANGGTSVSASINSAR